MASETPPIPTAENVGDKTREELEARRLKAEEASSVVYDALRESAGKGEAEVLDKMASQLEELDITLTTPKLRSAEDRIALRATSYHTVDRDRAAREDIPAAERLFARARLLAGDAASAVHDKPELLEQIKDVVGSK